MGRRVLRAHGQMNRRGRARPPRPSRPPTTHIATAPGQVWCWDITFLPALVTGQWFYLYLILDLYSRKIVGFEVHDSDSADHAVTLVRRTALTEGVHAASTKPVLHGDNGATLKATTVLAMLAWLGIAPSHSRPRVSDDNPYAEALFRTAKYRPEFPQRGFADLDAARDWATRDWAARFVHWYNHVHRHGAIRYVTPAERHTGRASRRRGPCDPACPPRPLSARTTTNPGALEPTDAELDADRRGDPQPGTGQRDRDRRQPEPAFRFG